MACIVKVGNKFENLSGYNTFITDKEINSQYFRISKFGDTFTAGKNLFLMEGSEFLKESTDIKIEIVDAEGNTLYVEPGRGVPDYYEGNSVVLSTHVYSTTPVGPAKITVLGELKEYIDESGIVRPVPSEWENAYNVKWEKNFYLNKNEKNSSPVIFYKKPNISIDEVESTILEQNIPLVTQTGSVVGLAENPPLGTDLNNWRAGELYRFERVGGDSFKSAMDESIISIPSINYQAVIKEVINSNVILVDSPLTDGDLKVINNPNELNYSITFEDFAARTTSQSAVTASYGKITVNNLDTFTGNVDKLKIYKKSRSDVGDYKFTDEVKIVGGNLLRNELIPSSDLDGGFGVLTEANVQTYWDTQSIQINGLESEIEYDNDTLYESLKINIPSSSFATQSVDIITNSEFELYDNTDYQLNFRTLVSGAYEDIIVGDVIITSESVTTTFYYKFRPSELTVFEPEYSSELSILDIESPNSQSVNLTKPLIYDDNRFTTYETPQNLIGNSFNSVPTGYLFDSSNISSITLDTSSANWGDTSVQISSTDSNANIVSGITSLGGITLNVMVWLDSGSYTLPMSGNPQDINVYSEFYSSGSDELAVLSFENIGGDAKLYYYNSSTDIGNLESFRNSTEYSLEPIDTNDYQSSPNWHTSSTGSQTIIPFQESGYNYIHIDYRTRREIEPLNANLINVHRLDSLNGDILYGSTYEINSINFETGDIEFSHNSEDGTLSGVLSLQDGKTILTVGSETQTWYIVELDFNNSIMVFIGELDFAELEVSQRSYDLYDLFDLSGSNWISTGSTELYVPRVPPRAGDYLYSNTGYPYQSTEFSGRNFLTTQFNSPTSSDDEFANPIEIQYIFKNTSDIIENVYVEDSDQIYVVSSLSSSLDINNTNYIYDQGVIYSGYFFTGSYSGSVYVDSSMDLNTYQVSPSNYISNITALNPISSSFGELNFVLLTDSGSNILPTNTSSFEFHYEEFQSASIIKPAIAFRNIDTDAKFYYNNSPTSQSVLQSYSGSTHIQLDSIDSGDFTNTELWFLSTGSQVILEFETGSNSHFFYIDYRTNRNSEPLNANLQEITAISQIGTTDFTSLKAREIFPYSGSTSFTGSVTSTDYYTSQLPLVAGNYLYQLVDYPFVPATISDGTYITDDVDPNTDVTIPDTQLQIPYVFDVVNGKVENVIVKRLDSIYTASSTNGTSTTSFIGPTTFIPRYEKEPNTIVPKTLSAFITGSYKSGSLDVPFKETLVNITADASFNSRKQIEHLFNIPISGSGKLGFSVRGSGWQLSKVELKPSQDVAFSPKVFNLLDEQDRNLPTETFDYRFELYDVNNNYIPVELNASKTFTGGNKVSADAVKILSFESDKSAFRFYSGSLANPPFQQVKFNFSKTNALSGSLTFESSAFDKDGNYIEPSTYVGTYPGGLSNVTGNNAILSIANFSGSDSNYEVSSIIYTASVQGIEEYETIIRLEDGQPVADLIINNDRNVVTFKQSTGEINPPNQNSTIKVKRKNLASNEEPITVNSSSLQGVAPPLTLLSDSSTTGVATYFISGSDLSLDGGVVEYEFTSSDEFGVQIDNSTTITPISFLGGVVLYLSNERGVLPAYFSGEIPSSSYVYTSGSTKLYIEGEQVLYNDGGGLNSYRITGVTGSGITPNEVTPTTNNYGGVPGTMLSESSSMEVNVRYTDSSGELYDFGREANFNIIREGEQGQPGLEGSNGPGLVLTGEWTGSRDYQFNESDALSRADAVIYNNNYYLAIQDSGPNTPAGVVEPTNTEYWENLGSGSRFVAAELAIFEESYVQNTINVGTNNSGSTSAANITIAGGTNYPYMSIGQSAQTGTQGYNVGNGIFMGINGNSGTASLSLESPILGGNELLWDGNNLTIRGTINVTNTEDFITPTDTGSFVKDEFTQSLVNPSEYSFGSIFTLASASAATGLNLTADYLGYYDGSTFGSYMDSDGGFYLGGQNGALQWDGNSLVVSGSIQVIGGNAATKDDVDNSVLSGSVSAQAAQTAAELFASTAAAHAVTSGSESATAAQEAATAQAINDASASINLLANGGWVGGSGTFITNKQISSPIIAANGGYISGMLKVGDDGITLDATGTHNQIYVGGGTYADSGTAFYVNDNNQFSLGDKLTWDGDDLTINGNGTFSGTLSAAGGTFTELGVTDGNMTIGFNDDNAYGLFFNNIPTGGSSDFFGITWTDVNDNTAASIFYDDNSNEGLTLSSDEIVRIFGSELRGTFGPVSIRANSTSGILRILGDTLEVDEYVSSSGGGNITATGNITAYYSDDRLKTKLGNITNPLSKIKALSGFYYKNNDTANRFGYTDDIIQIGVSAQEVQNVLPEIVKDAPFNFRKKINENGEELDEFLYDIDENDRYKTVQYEKMVPLLIEGIKELTTKVESLEEEIKKLKG